MICVSDNLATNLLLRAMTIEGTNDLIRRTIGDGISIDGFAGFRPGHAAPSMGRATPRALLAYLRGLAEERPPGAAETVAVARMQSHHSMIPRYLPVNAYGESPVHLANKTGALPGVRADIGLLESRGTTIAMVFMTADGADTGFTFTNEGEECIGQLARTAWEAWMGGPAR
jgi:beta-lactamase class A